ncbi:hypothetical protein JTB14_031371 [Gonioctena quinquepunctata]|nr:hypothetical protein JTB14_031371 [Gonioctena quinquepunctata]
MGYDKAPLENWLFDDKAEFRLHQPVSHFAGDVLSTQLFRWILRTLIFLKADNFPNEKRQSGKQRNERKSNNSTDSLARMYCLWPSTHQPDKF